MGGRRWTARELWVLAENRKCGAEQIGRMLGRSAVSVQCRAERAGIKLMEGRKVPRGVEIRFAVPKKTEVRLRAAAEKVGMKLAPYLRRLLVRLDQSEQGEARSSAKLTERQVSDLAQRLDAGLIHELRREAAVASDRTLVGYLIEIIEARRVIGSARIETPLHGGEGMKRAGESRRSTGFASI